jgi:molecular chaperone GrpE (heat shock protein)/DNA-binding Xre family transcriptional regulator
MSTPNLPSLMQSANISSLRALSRAAGVSRWQVEQLRRGQVDQMRVGVVMQLAQALQVPVEQLLQACSSDISSASNSASNSDSPTDSPAESPAGTDPSELPNASTESPSPALNPVSSLESRASLESEQLRQEFQRLQTQMAQQRQDLQQEFQQASLQILESWLTFYPSAAYQAQQDPSFSASKILPLIRPVEQLVKTWGVEMLASVGTELPYDPQQHQLREGTAAPGDLVVVQNPGYRQGEKLLYRATVRPVKAEQA